MNDADTNRSVLAEKVTMIIRAAGERSTGLCKKLIEEQGFEGNIFFTRETPFSAALRKSYDIGISEGRPWTFCVDADVLLRESSIQTLLKFAEDQPANVFEVQGFVHDKFFTIPRQAGNHLYRTSMLERAIKLIPDEGVDIRPESYVLRTMQQNGFPYKTFPSIIGLHDFEQFYFDVYRKAFVQAHKHLNYTEKMVPLWKENAEYDKDYDVALHGFTDGILNRKDVYIDKKQKLYREKFEKLDISEKDDVQIEYFDLSFIEEVLQDQLEDEYIHLDQNRVQEKISSKLKSKIKEHGLIKSLILSMALAMIKFGNKIKNNIDRKNR